MAAIDKLYLHSYDELAELKQWALAYYPKLFVYFYDWAFNVTRKEWNADVEKVALESQKRYKEDWKRLSPNGTINCAVAHIKREWNWEDEEAAREEAERVKGNAFKSIDSLKADVTFPVLNTPSSIDRKLKWICPLPTVRIYLQNQCGIRERWWYRLFWRGSKEFKY